MYKIKNYVTYEDIILNPFVFIEQNLDFNFVEYIKNLEIPETNNEVKYSLKNVNEEITQKIKEVLLKLPISLDIKEAMSSFSFDINKMVKGDFVPMHNECGQLSPFEILFWICPSSNFIGRDFIMKNEMETKSIKPKTGLFCFVNTLVTNVKHGVSPLESDDIIYSITGGLGRKNGFTNK